MKAPLVLTSFIALVSCSALALAANAPIPIAELKRTDLVSFDREVLPFLSDNCLACHCQSTKKGGLNLETPELMLKGGENGPAIVPKNAMESLALQAAAHLDADLAMPPRDNKAKAKNLTPEQLALFKLWIDQGAKPSLKVDRKLDWQPMPATLGAIVSVAVTADGQFAACARANRVCIYHLPSGRAVLNEVADRDQVNAVAFNPDGTLLATGGYREVKLWRRVPIEGKPAESLAGATGKITRGDGQRSVTVEGSVAKLCDAEGKVIGELRGNRFARELIDERDRALQIETGNVAYRKEVAATAGKALETARERVKKSAEAITPKQQEAAAKQKGLADAKSARTALEQTLATAVADLSKAEALLQTSATKAAQLAAAAAEAIKGAAAVDANKLATEAAAVFQEAAKTRTDRDQREALRKQTTEKIEAANKAVADAEEAVKKAETAKDAAATELELAHEEEKKTDGSAKEANAAIATEEAQRKKAEEALQTARQAATATEQPILAAAFSPDGATVATAGDDQFIHTWSAENGAAFDVLKGHKAAITALAFAPNGELISTASDGAALAWKISPEWKLERTIGASEGKSPFADRVNAVAFSPEGKLLATGGGAPSRGGEIELWDAATGRLVREVPNPHTDAVLALEFSPDGKLLASGAADKMARILDVATGKIVRSFEGHTHHVLALSWSADGRTLATAGADNLVKIWDAATGDRKKNIEGYEKEVTGVRFAGTGSELVTSSGDNKVRRVGLDGKEIRAFPEVSDFMESAAVTPDGKLVVAGGQDSVLRVWDANDGKTLLAFPR